MSNPSPPALPPVNSTGFRAAEVLIIQSLEIGPEPPTGEILRDYINSFDDPAWLSIRANVVNVEYAQEFSVLMAKLALRASAGTYPILHVECHGDKDDGLIFANGSTMSWDELSASLTQLNRATRFNLLAVFSACFGGHFLGQMHVVRPAPCWGLVAPTETANPAELMQGMREFYRTLFSARDLAPALRSIRSCRLSAGEWIDEAAEYWFLKMATSYIHIHCNMAEARRRARRLQIEGAKVGVHKSRKELLANLRHLNSNYLVGKFFNEYFMIESAPENAQRFQDVKVHLNAYLSMLRKQGGYAL